ncbi:MAG: M23 family metallopeptidase [Bdellovibrionaceae bacterium]|nr:M23 family metallopeptidase [Pseudobdellovibrionaceae bacterium]
MLGYGTTYPVLPSVEGEDALEPVSSEESESAVEIDDRAPASYRITSGKGRRRRPKRGASSFHKGIDYGMPCGTTVRAKRGGRISKAGWGRGYGKVVAVSYGSCRAIYGHLSSIQVRVGQIVGGGAVLGRSGRTGIATGCHLHYENCSRLYAELQGEPNKEKGAPSTPTVAEVEDIVWEQ